MSRNNSAFFYRLRILFAFIFSINVIDAIAQTIPVTDLETKAIHSIKSNLNEGATIELDWAQQSNIACFPGTRFYEYMGAHVFYRIDMPSKSNITISVTPIDKSDRINVYALRLGEGNLDVPPNLARAISCEADYPLYTGKAKLTKNNKEKTVELMSTTKSYTILIGVAGAKDLIEGEFKLNIAIDK